MKKLDAAIAAKSSTQSSGKPFIPTLEAMRAADREREAQNSNTAAQNTAGGASNSDSGVMSTIGDYGKSAAAGLGDAFQDVLNLPHTFGMVGRGGGMQAAITDAIRSGGNPIDLIMATQDLAPKGQKMPLIDLNMDQRLGIKNPDIGQSLVEGFTHYAPYALGGEALAGEELGAAKLADLPGAIGKVLSKIPGVRGVSAANLGVSSAFGAASNPNSPLQGGAESAAFGGVADMAPGALKSAWTGATDLIKPQKILNSILQELGGGQSLTDNAKMLSHSVMSAFKNRIKEGSNGYSDTFNSIVNPGLPAGLEESGQRITGVNNFKSIDSVIDHINAFTKEPINDADDLKEFLYNKHNYVFKNNKELLGFFNSVPNDAMSDLVGKSKTVKNSSVLDNLGTQEKLSPNGNEFSSVDDIIDHVKQMLPEGENIEDSGDLKDFLQENYGYEFKNNADVLKFFNNSPKLTTQASYNNLNPKILQSYNAGLEKLHNEYLQNPTFNNAHRLQSEIGARQRKIPNLNSEDLDKSEYLGIARQSLKSDIRNSLNKIDPALGQKYDDATNYWLDNVVPYVSNKAIHKMAKGEIENPRNIANIFKSPEKDVQKVVSDLGNDGSNRILYSVLGKQTASKSPENMENAYKRLDEIGMSPYVSDAVHQKMSMMSDHLKKRNAVESIAGALMGAAIPHAIAGSPLLDIVGGGAGLMFGKSIVDSLSKYLPVQAVAKGISKASKSAYSPLIKALMGSTIPGSQQ